MSSESQIYTRRQVLQLAGAVTLYLQGCTHSRPMAGTSVGSTVNANSGGWEDFLSAVGPVQSNLGTDEPKHFFGDHFPRAHQALWDVTSFLKNNPAPVKAEAQVPVVIVGGGISGLTSAYLLRDLKPIVLEQAPRFGGNSQGQTWRGVPYSIGAAYFLNPDSQSELGKLLETLGVLRDAAHERKDAQAVVDGHRVPSFFSGKIAAKDQAKFQRFTQIMKRYLNNPGIYPSIPTENVGERQWVNQFDSRSLMQHLVAEMGGRLPAVLEQWVDQYCWSSFGATAEEVSAAAGMNFLASEFGEIRFFPSGNAGVVERLLAGLGSESQERLLSEALVLKVEKQQNGFWMVLFVDKMGQVRRLEASTVVMACPKFVASKLLSNCEPRRLKTIAGIQYRAYCVAGVLIDGRFDLDTFDTFLLQTGNRGLKIEERAKRTLATDIVCGNYQSTADNTVLTLYRAFPYAAGRSELLSRDSWSRCRAQMQSQLQAQILPALGINASRIRGVRLARWGHPLPVPYVGCYRDGTVDQLFEPFAETAFFVHQDNWLLPSLETAIEEALRWAPRVRKSLAQIVRK